MKIVVFIFFISSYFLQVNSINSSPSDSLRLGTATISGNYHPLGLSIQKICDENTDFKIKVIATDGSVDNVNKIDNGELDYAIVQNDVAFFAENNLFDVFDKKIKNLRGIITFYPEPIFIITNDRTILNLSQLSNTIVNVGPVNSGLIRDAEIILNSEPECSGVVRVYFEPKVALEKLLNNDIQASFINNITEPWRKKINADSLFVLSLTDEIINRLMNTYSYFSAFTDSTFNEDKRTVCVKSILICKKDKDDNDTYKLTNILHDKFEELRFPSQNSKILKEHVISQISLKKWHDGSRKYFVEIGKIKSDKFLFALWLILLVPMIISIMTFSSNILLFSFNNKIHSYININSRFIDIIQGTISFISRHKYLIIIYFMVTLFLTDIFIIKYLEHDWAINRNLPSDFDNRTLIKNLLWMFVFGGSGFNDNLFPQSPLGKFFITLIPLIGYGGFATIAGLFTSNYIHNLILRSKGVKTKMLKNHIIICGWNENVPFLAKTLMHENIIKRKPVAVLANTEDEKPLLKYGLDQKMISFIKGDATNKDDLDRVNIKDADIAIIVADANSSDPDAKNILKVLTVEKYCHELEKEGKRKKNKRNIYTIVELQDSDKIKAVYDAYGDEVVLLGDIKSKILVQSVLNRGVSKFINEILTYNDLNDIYSFSINEKSKLVNHTFDDLLITFRKHKILLLSISVGGLMEKEEMNKVLNKYKLKRNVITNPFEQEELCYRTQPGDILIVLAQYEKKVEKALTLIEKTKDISEPVEISHNI
jgi:uncharacterized protein